MKRSRPRFIALCLLLAVASPSSAQWVLDGVLVSAASGTNVAPVVVPDGTGGALVAWQSSGTPRQVVLNHLLADGQIAPGFPATGLSVAESSGLEFMGAGTDGDHGIVLGWRQYPDGVAIRLHGDGTLASGWTAGGTVFTFPNAVTLSFRGEGTGGGWFLTRSDHQVCPDICYGGSATSTDHITSTGAGDGELVISTSPQLGATGGSIFPATSGSSFAYGWGGDGFDAWLYRVAGSSAVWWVHLDVHHETVLNAVDDGSGGGLVFTLGGYGTMPPRLLHVLATGALDPAWPADGVPVISESADPSVVPAVAANAGSTVFAWTTPGPNGTQVRMQKLTSSGAVAPGWPDQGLVLCDAPGARDEVALAPDGAGGAFATWRDGRDVAYGDLYAQHVRADGSLDPTFGTDGMGIVTLHAGANDPHIAAVAPGVAVVAWSDQRSGGDSGIRMQRVPIPGTLAVDPHVPGGGAFALAGFTPNPARGAVRVGFRLAEPGDATLELFDLLGRRMAGKELAALPAGDHSIALDGAGALPNGVYLIRVRAGGQERIARGLIAR